MQSAVIERRSGYLSADCERRDARELAELYRALAVECIATQADRMLVKANHCGADGHRALRDALTTIILAGMPRGLRLAMVTDIPSIRSFFLELQADLRRLNIDVALFAEERTAVEWLLGKGAARTSTASNGARPQA